MNFRGCSALVMSIFGNVAGRLYWEFPSVRSREIVLTAWPPLIACWYNIVALSKSKPCRNCVEFVLRLSWSLLIKRSAFFAVQFENYSLKRGIDTKRNGFGPPLRQVEDSNLRFRRQIFVFELNWLKLNKKHFLFLYFLSLFDTLSLSLLLSLTLFLFWVKKKKIRENPLITSNVTFSLFKISISRLIQAPSSPHHVSPVQWMKIFPTSAMNQTSWELSPLNNDGWTMKEFASEQELTWSHFLTTTHVTAYQAHVQSERIFQLQNQVNKAIET